MPGKTEYAIVAYDDRGFWLQNSWGPGWGNRGFALVTYDDWLRNGTDVWVARLGVPIILRNPPSPKKQRSSNAKQTSSYLYHDLRPHMVSLDSDGGFSATRTYGTSASAMQTILTEDFTRITQSWQKKRLCLVAPSGLESQDEAIELMADWRPLFLEREIYPLYFLWNRHYQNHLVQLLQAALNKRRPEGINEHEQDFMRDRLDDALEPVVRQNDGAVQWNAVKNQAIQASQSYHGGMRLILQFITDLMAAEPDVELHLIGHSAGSLLLAPLVQLFATEGLIGNAPLAGDVGYGQQNIASCSLWAPASTMTEFYQTYGSAIATNKIDRFSLFTLTDAAEQNDNCANIYHRSLLYLIAHALEEKPRIPFSPTHAEGTAIVGMEKFIRQEVKLQQWIESEKVDWILAPNTRESGTQSHSTARSHQSFLSDNATLNATLARILAAS